MLASVEKALEYDKIRVLLKKYTASQLGTARVDTLTPSCDVDKVRYLLTLCSEAKFFHELYGGIPLNGLKDIRKSLNHAAKVGALLDNEELLDVRKVAQIPEDIHRAFKKRDREEFPNLFAIVDALPVFPELVEAIGYCLDADGMLLDRASPELRTIRRKLYRLRENIHQKLEATLRSPEHQKAIQEPVITSRNNRYVIPIKQEARSSFRGVVQGQSTSGATYFVEPLDIVQMNNALHEAAEAEQREIRRILLELTDRVRDNLHELELSLDLLAEFDFLNAKARFSLALNAVEPKLNTRGVVKLIEARHPLLEFHLQNERPSDPDSERSADLPARVVPTNVHIGKKFNTLIITGPNTGGKTIVLKTVGLLVLMAQSGLHIPAEHGSRVAIFDHIFADIGDDQGIEQSLSTFSSHITKIAEMLRKIEHAEYSLVLLDEIGAGTDPSEGTALGMALLDWLGERQVNTIVTTHYGALKAYAHTQESMENASMEFDWTTLRPTYRLQVGIPGSSNAIKIASQLGIPSGILDEAQTHLGNNNVAVEDLLVRLQQTQDALETERALLHDKMRDAEVASEKHTQLLQTLETRRNTLKQQAESEARDIVANARKTIEKLVADIRKQQASKDSIRNAFSEIEVAKKSLKKELPKKQSNQPKLKVNVGDKVRVKKLGRFGEVTAIKPRGKTPLQILVGNMRMQAAYHEIDSVHPKQETSHLSTSVLDIQYSKSNTISSEINIRGLLVKEALDLTDKYLDDAYLAGIPTVRILHGKGTGALRKAVHDELRGHPHVTKYQFAPLSQGGEGVTVVTFKE
ncbi:MAG: endonuclease MutS2 [Candidatus Poribacteria bacterium]|nr:endonuclease MutS2 [Candidatus Poribacteria bacterium]